MSGTTIVWLRRDLRLDDNAAIFAACEQSGSVCLAFVLSPPLLASSHLGAPLACAFFDALAALREDLRNLGSDLVLLQGDFATELCTLAGRLDACGVVFAEDYEPEAIRRDGAVTTVLEGQRLRVRAVLDHAYFAAGEIDRGEGRPFRIFTPYKRRWLDRRADLPRAPFASRAALRGKLIARERLGESVDVPLPETFGFSRRAGYPRVSEREARRLLDAFSAASGGLERYAGDRNVPALDATSHLSPHLRAGTIGIRTCVERAFARRARCDEPARAGVDAWISELIWRDFYQSVLKQFPYVVERPFLPAAERIRWRDAPGEFAAWCEGRTGYPFVDAAMRDLNASGWMHNRLRMLVASFLTKHLLIDWRYGERYFEQRLADSELGSNNGGWQWAASVGTDAVPYFRIFNPIEQARRFDPDGAYVRSMVTELANVPAQQIHEPRGIAGYPAPIVEHSFARARALESYAQAFTGAKPASRSKA